MMKQYLLRMMNLILDLCLDGPNGDEVDAIDLCN